MFGIGKGKLVRDGAQIDGVVICSHPPADTGQGGVGNIYRIEVRVHFPDGSMAEFSSGRLDRYEVGWKLEGDIVPVRYDPTNRSRIEVDTPALTAAREADAASVNSSQNAAITRSEAELARRTGVDNQAD
jgi:hypothetical protein